MTGVAARLAQTGLMAVRSVLARDSAGGRDTALDGLRFFAFMLVFVSHFPNLWDHPWLLLLKEKGWMGVDLFFALSAYLFINIFRAEYDKHKRVHIPGYFLKRFARIYPLMLAFVLYMMWWKGTGASSEWLRIFGLALSLDNFFHAFHIAGSGIQMTEHLWSLSYEFQTYLIMPAVFLVATRVSLRTTIWLLICAALYGTCARFLVSEIGAQHPTVYALPFFRPESVIAGLALAFLRPTWHWQWSAIIAAASLITFFALPNPWIDRAGWIFSYPVLALFCGSIIDTALRSPLRHFLENRVLVHIGRRSYALYIFHILAINYGTRFLAGRFGADMTNLWWNIALVFVSLGFALLWAEISWRVLERPANQFAARVSRKWRDAPLSSAETYLATTMKFTVEGSDPSSATKSKWV